MKSFFIDLYHWDITGNTACTLTANTCTSANHAGPSVLIQNDHEDVQMGKRVIGCDLYNGCLTGDVACALTASMEVAGHTGPKIIVLNDQGGNVMSVSDKANTLRAQDHGHPPVVCMAFDVYNMQGNKHVFKTLNSIATDSDHIPVVCFEPGIAKREGSSSRFVNDKSVTLRAQMGDNQPAVCYPINLMVATRSGKDDMRTCFGIGEPDDPQFTLSAAHEHGVCYENMLFH